MISVLHLGMRLMLPSGNVVVLVRRERTHWVCEYTSLSRARGQVEFSGVYLRKFGVRV
jgi:hypothetical protein